MSVIAIQTELHRVMRIDLDQCNQKWRCQTVNRSAGCADPCHCGPASLCQRPEWSFRKRLVMQALDLTVRPLLLMPSRLRVGTRNLPLALFQTRLFMRLITLQYPALLSESELAEHAIATSGDHTTDTRLADIGGKGLPPRESTRRCSSTASTALFTASRTSRPSCLTALSWRVSLRAKMRVTPSSLDRHAGLPIHAIRGAQFRPAPWSGRLRSQILHRRPDLRIELLRGNVRTRLDKVKTGEGIDASLLAVAGLRRLGLDGEAALILDPDIMVPAAGQGIIGITVRAADVVVRDLLTAIEDPEARFVATAERALLAALDGSCRTPIGSYARLLDNGDVHLTGLIARANGRFLLKRSMQAPAADARPLGTELGRSLRADAPVDVFV
jgi:hydroxymethylbilane synthase